MQDLWQAKLPEEAQHLLVFLAHFGKLLLDYLLQDILELILKHADGGRDNMAQLLVHLGRNANLFVHLHQVHEILRIWLGKL